MSNYYHEITREIFYALSGALLLFSLLETVWPGLVLAYLNLNWLLIFWLITAILVVLGKQR